MNAPLQNVNGPAEAATSPDRGSIHPRKDKEMNETMCNTAAPNAPEPLPADDVNRAKAIVLTVWMALHSPDLCGCEGDLGAMGDTLYEAYLKLSRAERNMGGQA